MGFFSFLSGALSGTKSGTKGTKKRVVNEGQGVERRDVIVNKSKSLVVNLVASLEEDEIRCYPPRCSQIV